MAVKNVSFAEATPAQKRAFATNFLNLDIAADASDDQIDTAIRTAQPSVVGSVIFYEEPDEVAPAPKPIDPAALKFEDGAVDAPLRPEEGPGRQVGSLGKEDPRWTIEIPVVDSEDESGGRDVLVGVNGRAWQLKRGVPINVPHRVVVALQNASQTIVRHVDKGNGDVEEVRRTASRFPFTPLERPSQAEIDAWDKAMASQFCA